MSQSTTGTFWSMIERFAKMGIQLLCTFIIAQFLPPTEFGLIAMMTIFLAFSTIMVDGGFIQAIVHEQHVTAIDKSSLFWFNILLAFVIYLFFFLTAPLIASFYREPQLTILMRIAFLALIFQAVTVVQQALLFKSVNFKTVSQISLWASILSGLAGIIVSYIRKDVWGLIVQNLSFAIIQAILFWIYSNWHPRFLFSWISVRKYLRFSINLIGSNLLAAITDNLGNLFIGKAYASAVLGKYTIGYKLPNISSGVISYSIHRVSYSIMAKFQEDDDRLRDYSQKVVGMAFYLIAPLMIFFLYEADDIITLFLTPAWAEAAVFLRYFSIAGMVFCFSDINMDILLLKNRTDIVLRIDMVRRTLLIVTLLIGITQSIYFLLLLLTAYYLFNALFVSYIAGKAIQCSLWQQLRYQLNTIVCLLIAASGGAIIYMTIPNNAFLRFFLIFGVGLILYIVISHFTHNPYYSYFRKQLKK